MASFLIISLAISLSAASFISCGTAPKALETMAVVTHITETLQTEAEDILVLVDDLPASEQKNTLKTAVKQHLKTVETLSEAVNVAEKETASVVAEAVDLNEKVKDYRLLAVALLSLVGFFLLFRFVFGKR